MISKNQIVNRNPCYILSGLSMLLGCYLLNAALYTPAGDVQKLLRLLGAVNVYEILLVVLGLVLLRSSAFARDGRILLSLEGLFLCDITFTAGIISTVDASWGIGVSAGLLALSTLKLAVILRALDAPHRVGTLLYTVGLLGTILSLAPICKLTAIPNHGNLPSGFTYLWWCAAGAFIPGGLRLWQAGADADAPDTSRRPRREIGMVRMILVLPFLSLLLHLWSAGWVYSMPIRGFDISPLLLGLAAGLPLLQGPAHHLAGLYPAHGNSTLAPSHYRVPQLYLLAGAVLLSLNQTHAPAWSILGTTITPLRLMLVGSAAILAASLFRYWSRPVAIATAIAACVALLGSDVRRILDNSVLVGQAAWGQVPSTITEWGVTAMGMAFVLLFAGAGESWRRIGRVDPPTS